MKLEGDFHEVKRGDGLYSMDQFKKSLHELMNKVSTDSADNGNSVSRTYGGVSCIGGTLYVNYGASEDSLVYGFEYFAANSDDPRIRIEALKSLIGMIEDKIKDNHL